MSNIERLTLLQQRVSEGEIELEELPLELEPMLWQACENKLDEERIKKIVNDLELIIFTIPAQQQNACAAKLLGEAKDFLNERLSE